ncbi:hypothetical protein DV738_g2744, partial [Chaetothyriales sp. CBS 135597]
MGTNSKILEMQMGLESLDIPAEDFLAYYDTDDIATILAAIDDLGTYVEKAGPFDGVLGFSQGAVLAAMLLIRNRHAPPFKFAVFVCAGTPFSEDLLRQGRLEYVNFERDGILINIPSAHIIGSKDPSVDHAYELARVCESHSQSVYDHGAGHEIPRSPRGVTEEMVRVIEDVIAKATVG